MGSVFDTAQLGGPLGSLVDNATVTLYAASKLPAGGPTATTAAPPTADYGPITSGPNFGGTGHFRFTNALVVYGGSQGWQGPYAPLSDENVLHSAASGATPAGVDLSATAQTWLGLKSGPIADKGGAVYNVKASPWNAVGDGVADDAAAINAAAVAAKTTNGTLYFPAGTYKTIAQLVWDAITVDGAGPIGATIAPVARAVGVAAISIRNTTGNTYFPKVGNLRVAGAYFYSLGVKGNVGNGIRVEATGNPRFENLTVSGFDSGMDYAGSGGHIYAHNLYVTNNYYGVYISANSFDYFWTDCVIGGNAFANFATAQDQGFVACNWINCHLGFAPYSIYQEATKADGTAATAGALFMQECLFRHVRFEAVGNAAILCDAPFNIAGIKNSCSNILMEHVGYSKNATYKIAARNDNYAVDLPLTLRTIKIMGGPAPFAVQTVNAYRIRQNGHDAFTLLASGASLAQFTVDNGGSGNIFTGTSDAALDSTGILQANGALLALGNYVSFGGGNARVGAASGNVMFVDGAATQFRDSSAGYAARLGIGSGTFVSVLNAALTLWQSASAPALATGGTIATAAIGVSRVAPAAAVTGVILAAGGVAGQQVTVVNESVAASSVTFAAAPGGNVADGAASPLAGLTSRSFTWDSATALWYRAA